MKLDLITSMTVLFEDLAKTSKLMNIKNELLEEMLKLREDDIATNRQKIAAIAHKRDDPSLTNQTQRNQYDCALNAVKMIFNPNRAGLLDVA